MRPVEWGYRALYYGAEEIPIFKQAKINFSDRAVAFRILCYSFSNPNAKEEDIMSVSEPPDRQQSYPKKNKSTLNRQS